MAGVKGTLLVHFRDYVREHEGDAEWDRVIASLSPADAAVFAGVLLQSPFYPVGALNRAVAAFMHRRPNPRLTMQQLASYTAERDLPTLYKVLMKLATLESILRRAESVWRRYFDEGSVACEARGPKHYELLLSAPTDDDAGPGPLICGVAVPTWWQHAFRIARVRAAIVHEPCRFGGADVCRFTVRW
jgi:hypothetical protein